MYVRFQGYVNSEISMVERRTIVTLVFLGGEKTKFPFSNDARIKAYTFEAVPVLVSKGRVYLSRHKASGFQSSVKGRPPGVVA